MRWWSQVLGLIVGVVAMLGLVETVARAQPVPVAAYIVGLDRPSTSYFIRRGPGGVRAMFYTPLINGDIVQVLDPAASIVIRFIDGRMVRVTRANPPLRIWVNVTRPSTMGNVSGTVWQNVTRSNDSGLRTAGGRSIEDDGPLRLLLPGLSDGEAKIARGRRHFALEWRGGSPPYRVQLRDNAGNILLDRAEIVTPRLVLGGDAVAYVPGKYGVSIEANGERATGTFEAVQRLPSKPPHAAPAFLTGDARTTWLAAGLVEANPKQFSYEAYMQIQDAAERGWQPAVELRTWLGGGAPVE